MNCRLIPCIPCPGGGDENWILDASDRGDGERVEVRKRGPSGARRRESKKASAEGGLILVGTKAA
jgi:hypothetical protein